MTIARIDNIVLLCKFTKYSKLSVDSKINNKMDKMIFIIKIGAQNIHAPIVILDSVGFFRFRLTPFEVPLKTFAPDWRVLSLQSIL